MRVAIIVARAVDCCVGVALASGRAALWVALERRAQWVVLVGILAWPLALNAKGAYAGRAITEPPICLEICLEI